VLRIRFLLEARMDTSYCRRREGSIEPPLAAQLVIIVSKFNICSLPKQKMISPASIVFCVGGIREMIMRG
jgi:hypothetical protein